MDLISVHGQSESADLFWYHEGLLDISVILEMIVLDRTEVIEKKLFGRENEHPLFKEMLGDYLGYSRSNKTLFFYGEKLKSMHGSMTEDEMVIPLIAFGI